MKKFLLLYVLPLLLVAVIGIGGMWLYSLIGNKTKEVSSTESGSSTTDYAKFQKEKDQQELADTANYNKAVAGRNKQLCEIISDEGLKNRCQNALTSIDASTSNSIDTCNQITDTGSMEQCRDTINQNLAISAGDRKQCSLITDTSLRSHCESVVDEKSLQGMVESGTITTSFCKTIGADYQDECLLAARKNEDQLAYSQAMKLGEISYCGHIKDATLRDACSDTILLKRALVNTSMDDCLRIKDETKKVYCTSHISTKNDATLFKEYVASANLDGCETLTDENLKNRCHDVVTLTLVRTNKDNSLCQTLTNTGMIATCNQSIQ